MAVLDFSFAIDSEVHPELHAALAAIASEASRGERLRQLAAMGLVWEKVRAAPQGQPVAVATAAPQLSKPAADGASATAAQEAAPTDGRHIPVLVDVVNSGFAPLPSVEPAPSAAPEPAIDEDHVYDIPTNVSSIARTPASMSRLKRMSEKGLFRNG